MQTFFKLDSIDEFKGEGTVCMASTRVDSEAEQLAWEPTKQAIVAWSEEAKANTGGRSLGNLRSQHDPEKAIGIVTGIHFDDQAKKAYADFKVIDPLAKEMLREGVYQGASIGGAYAARQPGRDGVTLYIPKLAELSLVDKPSNPDATFTVIRANGARELRKFASPEKRAHLLPLLKSLAAQRGTSDSFGFDLSRTTGSPGLVKRERYAIIDPPPAKKAKRVNPNVARMLDTGRTNLADEQTI